MARTNKTKAEQKLKEMPPFFREQLVAKRIYSELVRLDRPSRRRVLGSINNYAMDAEKYVRGPQQEAEPPFTLDDEEE